MNPSPEQDRIRRFAADNGYTAYHADNELGHYDIYARDGHWLAACWERDGHPDTACLADGFAKNTGPTCAPTRSSTSSAVRR